MANSNSRVDALTKDNFDTWKIQAEALLAESDLWEYVSGEFLKPEVTGDTTQADHDAWLRQDRKARSKLILCISPSELTQIRDCITSKQIWDKLHSIYASKGPARKVQLLTQLLLLKMSDGDDVRQHISYFFDIIDKLTSMDIEINGNLLTIMLLYSLPDSFENFRYAITTRDDLPSAETLKIKIIEESEARKQKDKSNGSGAFFSKAQTHGFNSGKPFTKNKAPAEKGSKVKCHYCKKIGHVIAECRKKKRNEREANLADNTDESYLIECCNDEPTQALYSHGNPYATPWCLDSGATSHLCSNEAMFTSSKTVDSGLRLASSAVTPVAAIGNVKITTNVGKHSKRIELRNVLYVPELRTNLLSVSKLVDKGNHVTFTKEGATVHDGQNNVRLQAKRVGNLFYLSQDIEEANTAAPLSSAAPSSTIGEWHRRLGHLNYKAMKILFDKGHLKAPGLKFDKLPPCETCIAGKFTRLPFPKRSERSTTPSRSYTRTCAVPCAPPHKVGLCIS